MPMSAAERKQLSRKRKQDKMNEEEMIEFRKTEAKRISKYRKSSKTKMTFIQKKKMKNYERDRKRDWRQRQKDSAQKVLNEDAEGQTVATPQKIFKSLQSKGKAINKAKKNLPSDMQRRGTVIQHIVMDHIEELTPTSRQKFQGQISGQHSVRKRLYVERKPRNDKISKEIEDHVKAFYEQDDVSRIFPGKKDDMRVILDGESVRKQKRLMLMTTREAYAVYKKEFPTNGVGKTKFQEFRPLWVLPTTGKDQDICLCRYHENIELILRKIRPFSDNVPLYANDVVKHTVCSMDDEVCIDRDCKECGPEKFKDQLMMEIEDSQSTKLSYYQWMYVDGKISKEEVNSDLTSALDDLTHQLQPFSRDVYNAWKQHSELKQLKNSLKPGEIIIHEDFSENYNLKHQGEVQTAYWATNSCTLFTAVVYYQADNELRHQSYTLVSDELTHDKNAVIAFNKVLLEDLKKQIPFTLTHVHYWSDGAASQFKNKFCFVNMLFHEHDFGCTMDWSFFETAHGKGAFDGVGGTVKRVVWLSVLRKRTVVSTAEKFAEIASQLCKEIRVIFVSAKHIKKLTEECEGRWKDCRGLPQTLKIHFVRPHNAFSICAAANTSYAPDAVLQQYDLLPPNLADDINDACTSGNQPQPVNPHSNEVEIHVGQWYAVYFKEFNYWYVGITQKKNESGKAQINFLQQKEMGKNIFIFKLDTHLVSREDIFYKLEEAPTPISLSRSTTMTLKEEDFKIIENIFKVKYA